MNEPRKSRRLNTSGANHARQETGTGFDTPVQQHRPAYDQDRDTGAVRRTAARPASGLYDQDADPGIPSTTAQRRTVKRTAQTRQTAAPAASRSVYHAPRPQESAAGHSAPRSTGSGRGTTPPPQHPKAHTGGAGKPRRPKKKKGCLGVFLTLLLVMFGLSAAALGVTFFVMTDGMKGDVTISDFINTPKELQGDQANILVCGIDYEEGRAYSNDPTSNDGMTDMIMYVHFDLKGHKISMMQIPRNTFVGDSVPNTNGQINSVALAGGSVDALAQVIYDQFKLPVDYYVTIDMQSLKEIVDTFGGVRVYVPHDMAYGGSSLQQGYQTLNGDAAEFFVRNRHGEGYANSDLDRLTMQRYFYSGLLRRFRTMTVWDVAKLLPVFRNYVKTDMSAGTMVSMGVSLLKVDSANIMMCRTPEYGSTQYYNNNSVINAASKETADLLNQYFRTYTEPVNELNLASWYPSSSFYDANISYMGALDNETKDAQQNNNLDGSEDEVPHYETSAGDGASSDSGSDQAA